jgi:hypothetical protein
VSARILEIDPKRYFRHAIHGEGRVWSETNCYTDLWIELLHALGREPIAGLPFTVAIDFEGDQWTFFKFPLAALSDLYGVDVQELAIWRPLAEHVDEQLARGRPCLVEVDSFHLPDTAGTAYRRQHVKTTVAVTAIDIEGRHLGYFHNAGYFELRGDDFDELMRVREPRESATLPPYVEFAKIGAPGPTGEALRARSRDWLRRELARAPRANPFPPFQARLARDLAGALGDDLETFHTYSFATIRQFGACYELTATYLGWLEGERRGDAKELARPFQDLAETAKAFQFQLARATARHKPLDLTPLDRMAERWQQGITGLQTRYL